MPKWRASSLLLGRLDPVYDRYRIRMLQVLLAIFVPMLLVEGLTAWHEGMRVIAISEAVFFIFFAVLFRFFWRNPHHFGNAFIFFSIVISVLSVTRVLENEVVLVYLVGLPTFFLFFLGLRRGTILLGLLCAILGAAVLDYWLRAGKTPWPEEVSFLALFVFVLVYTLTAAYERTNRLLLDSLREKAERDELTGLVNRRRFFELFAGEMERSRRYGAPLSLVLLDADHFKRINDLHGHQVGDRVLRAIADHCSAVLRRSDVLGRVGGEEFACLLPGADREAGVAAAEKMRATVAADREDGLPACTVSAGVAELRADDTRETLYRRADQALYAAKARGRDRVEGEMEAENAR